MLIKAVRTRWAVLLFGLIGTLALFGILIPVNGWDWIHVFRPACLAVISGQSPYSVGDFYSPPWVLVPLLPLTLLPERWGAFILAVVNFLAFVLALERWKINRWLILPFLLAFGALANSLNGNLEGLIALGMTLPAPWGLFFALAKPQVGAALAVFWVAEAWQKGGIRQAGRIVLPVSIVIGLSFLWLGNWVKVLMNAPSVWWNASIFPYGIPVGLGWLALAFWKRDARYAVPASPFFAPYLTGHSWAFAWLGAFLLISDFLKERNLFTTLSVCKKDKSP